jgi:guanylate kinase
MIHLLTERNPQFKEVISYTSRAMREEEMPDINYHYISLEQFEE